MDDETRAALAPSGRLRFSINLGNPILARRDAASGELAGVSVDLARDFAAGHGFDIELVAYDAAGKAVAGLLAGEVDLGFFAIEPARAADIAFSEPYVLIEGCYLVKDGSPVRSNQDVDVAGTSVTVGAGSAYDLFLTRTLEHATIVRAPTSPAVVQHFLEHETDVAAGVRQQLAADLEHHSGLRILPEAFMTIRQAMGVAKTRGAGAARLLEEFVAQKKAEGFIGAALARHHIEGAQVAP